MKEIESISFVDGGKQRRTARIEREDGAEALVVTVLGQTHRIPIDTATTEVGTRPIKKTTTVASVAAYALLAAFTKWKKSYGARVAMILDDRRVVAHYQEHPPDRGISRPHPGVTLLDAGALPKPSPIKIASALEALASGEVTRALLDAYLGKGIASICTAFHAPSDNHCAHFVSHVLGYAFGATCGPRGQPNRSNLRVQEIFAKSPEVGAWGGGPALDACLVFVTARANVDLAKHTMVNVTRKHVGIYLGPSRTGTPGGLMWHYHNGIGGKVVCQPPDEVLSDFRKKYESKSVSLFYGTLIPEQSAAPRARGPRIRGRVDVRKLAPAR